MPGKTKKPVLQQNINFQHACKLLKSCVLDFLFEDEISRGPKLKEAFLKTGQFSDVQAVVKQLRSKKVKDEDTEKPVTKQMLKEIYKWDECCPQTGMCNLTVSLNDVNILHLSYMYDIPIFFLKLAY